AAHGASPRALPRAHLQHARPALVPDVPRRRTGRWHVAPRRRARPARAVRASLARGAARARRRGRATRRLPPRLTKGAAAACRTARKPNRRYRMTGYQAERARPVSMWAAGFVVFAGSIMLIVGVFHAIQGLVAI